jgi:hypothetical protein
MLVILQSSLSSPFWYLKKEVQDYFSELLQHFFHSFVHSLVCLTTGPQPLPERVLHRVRSSASSSNLQRPLSSLRSSSSCLRLIPRLPVTYILSSILPFITCSRRQFLRKIWPIQLTSLLFILRRIFLSYLTLCNTLISHTISPNDFLHLSPAPNFKPSRCFWCTFQSDQITASYIAVIQK